MKRETLNMHANRYVVGLMSGTSVDGIDAAVVHITDGAEGNISVQLIAFENTPYPAAVRQEIFALFDPLRATVNKLGSMNVLLGELYAEAALSVIKAAGLTPADIAVIGSHGQTIYHAPETETLHGYDIHYTVQIGEGLVIAARAGIPCVTDFRPADMAAGGQGAPLVPFTEFLLYREDRRTLLLQNIGGIGNMTVIPAGCMQEQVFAFDTGPGNMIIDGIVERLFSGLTMDIGGEIARRGMVHAGMLELLKQNPYYSQPLPKSTGRELFGSSYIDWLLDEAGKQGVKPEDVVATVTLLTVWSIGDAYRRYVRDRQQADAMIVGGGGSYNPVLIGFLRQEMEPMGVQVMTQEQIGQSSDAKEAVAFALLADYAIRRQPNNLPNVTGAGRPVIMGKISY
ncbi:anhydro-N-acetylmuramic acid kinase [Paenibacillus sp.]|jgi:anhydro-N-acetylmuramic acid kinase|uniref:anhydro-N-acetylmuramic acid kinase n=1 Tax=Paenibacillus sp. TaxID=58172 RepID=UPI00283336E0|nr:anhydro-N-acetylmuramic acid kinase [Paenibacillus sp.]MDR0270718.1 anhydro-N-acetylmuramic acid kinase [Paenibacillus sp.]